MLDSKFGKLASAETWGAWQRTTHGRSAASWWGIALHRLDVVARSRGGLEGHLHPYALAARFDSWLKGLVAKLRGPPKGPSPYMAACFGTGSYIKVSHWRLAGSMPPGAGDVVNCATDCLAAAAQSLCYPEISRDGALRSARCCAGLLKLGRGTQPILCTSSCCSNLCSRGQPPSSHSICLKTLTVEPARGAPGLMAMTQVAVSLSAISPVCT